MHKQNKIMKKKPTGRIATDDIVDPDTGEIIVENGDVITEYQAHWIVYWAGLGLCYEAIEKSKE